MSTNAANTLRTSSEGSSLPFNITPSDSSDCTHTRALHANTTGYIRVTGIDQPDDAVYVDLWVVAGVVYPYWVRRVWDTVLSGTRAEVKGLA